MSNITLVKTHTVNYKDLLPRKEYLYAKIMKTGTILCMKGDIGKHIFKKTISRMVNRNVKDIDIEFFNDFISNIIDVVINEKCAYQFAFQHKNDLHLYTCSIYPCFVFTNCESVDMVIRRKADRTENTFFTSLKNTTI